MHWLPEEPGIGRYMGVPFWAYKSHRHLDSGFPFPLTNDDTDDFNKLVARIYRCFELPNGSPLVYIPGLTNIVKTIICNKILYPCAVVDVDYDAVDSMAYGLYRRTLRLPHNYPTALLFWELRHLPAKLDACGRWLRQTGRYVHRHPVYHLVLKTLFDYVGDHQHQVQSQLFTYGPLKRFLRFLNTVKISRHQTLRQVLFPTATTNVAIFRQLERLPANEWKALIHRHLHQSFQYWVLDHRTKYPHVLRTAVAGDHRLQVWPQEASVHEAGRRPCPCSPSLPVPIPPTHHPAQVTLTTVQLVWRGGGRTRIAPHPLPITSGLGHPMYHGSIRGYYCGLRIQSPSTPTSGLHARALAAADTGFHSIRP
jgi:hypothetical protein